MSRGFWNKPKTATLQAFKLLLLARERLSTREIAVALGVTHGVAYDALVRLESRGLARGRATAHSGRTLLWEYRDADAASCGVLFEVAQARGRVWRDTPRLR